MKKLSVVLFVLSLVSSVTLAQIDDTTAETNETNEAVTDTIAGVDTVAGNEVENVVAPVENTQPEQGLTITTPEYNRQLLQEGTAKKNTGDALTAVGGVFVGATMVYTIMFIVDKQKFGIHLGGSSNGAVRIDYYLNPGLFGMAIGAPCLATGIVNMIKGNNMIDDAKSGNIESSLHIKPYLVYNYRTNTTSAGAVVNF